jgi:hypothetical protein
MLSGDRKFLAGLDLAGACVENVAAGWRLGRSIRIAIVKRDGITSTASGAALFVTTDAEHASRQFALIIW